MDLTTTPAERYWLRSGDEPARQVTRAEWVTAEYRAGFAGSSPGEPATWSWIAAGDRGWRERVSGP